MIWDILAAVTRFAIFAGVLFIIGAVAFERVVLVAVSHHEPGSTSDVFVATAASRTRRLSLAVAAVMVFFVVVRFILQVHALLLPSGWLATGGALLGGTQWAKGSMVQLGAVLLFTAARVSAGPTHGASSQWDVGVAGVLLGVIGMAIAPALTGHAIASEGHPVLAVVADTLHVGAAATWLGTLGVIVLVGIPSAAADRVHWGDRVARMVRTLSPIALTSAAVIVGTGVVASWMHLDRFSSLWTSPYGRLLAIKVALFGLVVVVGAYNWRRATPRLREVGGVEALMRSAALELVLATGVLVITAVLVATAMPGES